MKPFVVVGLALAALGTLGAGAVFFLEPARTAPVASPAGRESVISVVETGALVRSWPRTLAAGGRLAPWQEAVIGSELDSLRITALLVDVGSVVVRGQEMARLSHDGPRAELRRQEAALAQARAALAQAGADARRARLVKDSGALSEQRVAQYLVAEETAAAAVAAAAAAVESARIVLAQTSLRAMDDGVVIARSATLGQVVSSGAELFRLLRQGRVEWQAELDARQLARVRPGMVARLTLPGGERIEGQVRVVSPALDGATGRAIAYVALPAGVTAGAFVSGEIDLGEAPAVTLPQSAVVLRDGRAYVFTVGADGTVTRQGIVVGRRRDGYVEIVEGLPAAARVVEAGGALLSDGARVTVLRAEGGP